MPVDIDYSKLLKPGVLSKEALEQIKETGKINDISKLSKSDHEQLSTAISDPGYGESVEGKQPAMKIGPISISRFPKDVSWGSAIGDTLVNGIPTGVNKPVEVSVANNPLIMATSPAGLSPISAAKSAWGGLSPGVQNVIKAGVKYGGGAAIGNAMFRHAMRKLGVGDGEGDHE